MVLAEEDEITIHDSTYIFEGRITIEKLPFSEVTINEMSVTDDGTFILEVINKSYLKLLANSKSDISEMSMEEILNKYGDQKVDNLSYKVQVGAYSNPRNYTSNHLKELGEVSRIVLEDGITRFMIGEYETLREAKLGLQKVINKGQEDAFILLFLKGERTYLEDLIEIGIFK
mgnify:CR=1 FL=1